MRAGRLVALLMGIQFIPWPRLTLHFMLNKRPGYAVPSSILAPTINYTHTGHRVCARSKRLSSFFYRRTNDTMRSQGGRERAMTLGDNVREPRRNKRGTFALNKTRLAATVRKCIIFSRTLGPEVPRVISDPRNYLEEKFGQRGPRVGAKLTYRSLVSHTRKLPEGTFKPA